MSAANPLSTAVLSRDCWCTAGCSSQFRADVLPEPCTRGATTWVAVLLCAVWQLWWSQTPRISRCLNSGLLCCDVPCSAGDILVFLTGQAEIDKAVARLNTAVCALPEGSAGDLLVLPLYAALPPELQLRVFRPPQPGVRRCIIATNVAETSITVEGVVYVVDSGVMKLKTYSASTGMDSLDVTAISRVQAAQRAGRAGRTRPGKVSDSGGCVRVE